MASKSSTKRAKRKSSESESPPWEIKGLLYCPVSLCPRSDHTKAKGWETVRSLRDHMKEHQGRAKGAVPTEYLEFYDLKSCPVCGKLIAKSRKSCPSCAPKYRMATSNNLSDTSATDDLPSLDEIFTTRARLLKYIPKRARPIWGEVLAKATASVVHLNTGKCYPNVSS